MLSKLRDPISALTHLAGAAASLIGFVILLLNAGRSSSVLIAITIYGACLFSLFTASSVYHSAKVSPGTLKILRKFDHSAIYLLIAGTYTPFCLLAFTGFWNWGLLTIIWVLAAIGILVKIFIIRPQRWLNAGLYVAMGWLVVLAGGEMLRVLSPTALFWLIAGGLIYTAGAVVYSTKKLDLIPGRFGFHEVWHIFVLLGAGAHYIAIFSLLTGK